MNMIHGVQVKPLKVHPDERGMVMEILRSDEKICKKFGQLYMTTCYPGVVKAWHSHRKQWDHFTCVRGMVKLVLHDTRPDSPSKGRTQEFYVGDRSRILVAIPPDVLHGFMCVSGEEAIMLNVPTMPYNHAEPDEQRRPWDDPEIPYVWERKNG